MSEVRAKAELVLQDQRLRRITKNFDLQKREIERRFQQESFIDEQNRKRYLLSNENIGVHSQLPPNAYPDNFNVRPEPKADEPSIFDLQKDIEEERKMAEEAVIEGLTIFIDNMLRGSPSDRQMELLYTINQESVGDPINPVIV